MHVTHTTPMSPPATRTRVWLAPLARRMMAVTVILLALASCGNEAGSVEPVPVEGTAGPAGVGFSPAVGPDASAAPSSTAGAGCPAGGTAVPKDSNWVGTDDLDGDGMTDQLWLAHDEGVRLLGVTTAGGARFSVMLNQYDAGAMEQRVGDQVSAVAGRLGDGSAVILVNFGRTAALYGVVNCYIVATTNVENSPYLFDLGIRGAGDGVGCPTIASKRVLAGYLAEYDSKKNTYKVTRTTINIAKGGKRATNGARVVLGTDVAEGSEVVKRAQSVSCGDNNEVTEPAP